MTTQLNLSENATKVNSLSQEQRDAAYDAARRRIAGDEPVRSDEPVPETFQRNAFAKYPPELQRTMRRLGYFILTAAFVPSAIRIFIAAFTASVLSIQAFEIGIIIGLMAVLLAEAGQVAFTLWASATEEDGWPLRWGLRIGAWGCTAFALVGNAYVVRAWETNDLFAWFEMLMPPILVLIAANVLKSQALHAIEERHAAHQLWQEAHNTWEAAFKTNYAEWQLRYSQAHLDAQWDAVLANALWNALRRANRQSTRVMREITIAERRTLVMRERSAEEWWQAAEEAAQRNASTQTHTGASTGATGEVAESPMRLENGVYIKVCPQCSREFSGKTKRKATNSLVAHMKSHANQRKAATQEAEEPQRVSLNGQQQG